MARGNHIGLLLAPTRKGRDCALTKRPALATSRPLSSMMAASYLRLRPLADGLPPATKRTKDPVAQLTHRHHQHRHHDRSSGSLPSSRYHPRGCSRRPLPTHRPKRPTGESEAPPPRHQTKRRRLASTRMPPSSSAVGAFSHTVASCRSTRPPEIDQQHHAPTQPRGTVCRADKMDPATTGASGVSIPRYTAGESANDGGIRDKRGYHG